MSGSFVYLQRAEATGLFRSQRFWGEGENTQMKSRGNTEETGCAREVNPPLSRERNTFNYVLLHLI